jgi:hypothetical protein
MQILILLLTNNVFLKQTIETEKMFFFRRYAYVSSQIANLLDCTTWSGAGPGLMDAVTQGALLAGKPVGGFKIGKEAGEWTVSNFHPYLPSENYLTCR